MTVVKINYIVTSYAPDGRPKFVTMVDKAERVRAEVYNHGPGRVRVDAWRLVKLRQHPEWLYIGVVNEKGERFASALPRR